MIAVGACLFGNPDDLGQVARGDALIGVKDKDPGLRCGLQGGIAGFRKGVLPFEFEGAETKSLNSVQRGVRRPRVHNYDFTNNGSNTGTAASTQSCSFLTIMHSEIPINRCS